MLSDSFTFRDRSTNHDVFKINENNAVSLYYQNSAKLSTTSIGAQIDTTLRLYGAAGTGGGRLRLAEGAAYSEIRGVRNTDTSSELWFGTEIGDTVDYRAKINTGGHFIPGTDSTYDLGLTGTRWRNVYADTLYGDGSNLTGIAADKIFEGNTEVETVDTGSDGTIKFTTEGSERARITSGGAFLVGATSSAGARAIIQQNSSDTNPLDQQTCADSSGLRIQNYSFGVGRYSALSLECANASSVQSASIVAQSVSSGTSPDIIITQRTSNSVNTERLRIQSDGTVIFANKLTNSSSYTTHNANFYGGNTNTGGVRIEVAHNNTTVSGNTAQGSFPHHLNLTNYSGSGSADNRMVTIGFDIPTTSTHANGAIAYQATGAGQGDFSFWTETGNAIYERLRIKSDGSLRVKRTEADIWLESSGPNAIWRILGSTGGATHRFRIYDQTNTIDRFGIDSSGRVFMGPGDPSSGLGILNLRHTSGVDEVLKFRDAGEFGSYTGFAIDSRNSANTASNDCVIGLKAALIDTIPHLFPNNGINQMAGKGHGRRGKKNFPNADFLFDDGTIMEMSFEGIGPKRAKGLAKEHKTF